MFLTSASVVQAGFHGALGMAIVSENAFDAGVGSLPHPIADVGWGGWIWFRQFSLISSVVMDTGTTSEAGLVLPSGAALRIEIDAKAQRKVKVTDVQCFVLDVVEIGTASAQIMVNTRVLDLLP
jgi:hypothetical protein